ncbi:glycosyltransferase [Methylobacillus caricis]|uniref:glycosyltransferase n=1 Tax=Methylobacillus caricis TaxID=1971611 RepID=UPI001D000DF1|nr:glycosyltransferase [Methylobacillus caricis]MCB5187689.1 glycosyltransferase [Methylobacillus caricis]
MRILHSAALLSPPPGILNQMRDESRAAQALGITWDVVMFSPELEHDVVRESRWVCFQHESMLARMLAWLFLRIEYHAWLLAQAKHYDAFVLRYYVHDPFQLLFILLSSRPVFFVHHTLEVPELAMEVGILSHIRSGLERLFGALAIKACAGTIGVTHEIISHELARTGVSGRTGMLYPNGIFTETATLQDERGDIPELIFVAGFFASWHGLDLLLDAIQASEKEFVIHLVGQLEPEDLHRAQLDSRVVLHGKLDQAQIRALSARCWLGLSSFALDRKSMREACTLKVREYLASGLAVYAGHADVFPDDAKFFKHGPLDIPTILAYAQDVRELGRQDIAVLARPYIDKTILLGQLYASLQQDAKKNKQ